MTTPDGQHAIAYNGELYNDLELRAELEADGVRFRTNCDTETVLWAFAKWGSEAVGRFRGMFAVAWVDRDAGTLVLSRDPLGVKPLYATKVHSATGAQLVFGSEIPALLSHPDASCEPDWVTVSAYLTTIRPTLGSRTMFDGVETLLPGETRVYAGARCETFQRLDAWDESSPKAASAAETRALVDESVRVHLRSDVPMCALLSGGLDSAIVASVANGEIDGLRTYCAGARIDSFDDDFSYAKRVAERLGTDHTEVVIDERGFGASWVDMVGRMGVPLSTPNEVAIHAVASSLARDGHVVTVSGEGADELFGGYGPVMARVADHVAALGSRADEDGGLFHLRENAWVSEEMKKSVVRASAHERADRDEVLRDEYLREFRSHAGGCPGDSGIQAHLRFLRSMNLPNLLRRLDSATMLSSVEGRTPFSDVVVARHAESLPMAWKYSGDQERGTKRALREGYRNELPAWVLDRPKASFPLPFQQWCSGQASTLRASAFAHELFNREAVETVASAPEALWNLAWPMMNLAMWGERWWGTGWAKSDLAETRSA